MSSPRYLILDEPVEGLAPLAVDMLINGLQGVRERLSPGIVIVERNMKVVGTLTETAAVLVKGRVAYWGSTASLLGDGERLTRLLAVSASGEGSG
jgi:branched-chain amino acid transport system ATP-binding protein